MFKIQSNLKGTTIKYLLSRIMTILVNLINQRMKNYAKDYLLLRQTIKLTPISKIININLIISINKKHF
jgi:hypothetical protein